jgi:hypothetical protein
MEPMEPERSNNMVTRVFWVGVVLVLALDLEERGMRKLLMGVSNT